MTITADKFIISVRTTAKKRHYIHTLQFIINTYQQITHHINLQLSSYWFTICPIKKRAKNQSTHTNTDIYTYRRIKVKHIYNLYTYLKRTAIMYDRTWKNHCNRFAIWFIKIRMDFALIKSHMFCLLCPLLLLLLLFCVIFLLLLIQSIRFHFICFFHWIKYQNGMPWWWVATMI